MTVIFKFGSKIWGSSSKKFGGSKTSNFWTTLRLQHEYLRTGTRYHRSENAVASYYHSCGKLYTTTSKHSTEVLTQPKSTFLDTRVSGDKQRFLLEILQ